MRTGTCQVFWQVSQTAGCPCTREDSRAASVGVCAGGGVEGPSLAIRTMVVHSHSVGVSLGLLFVDIRAAFYSVLAEEALGTMLTPQSRAVTLGRVGFTAA